MPMPLYTVPQSEASELNAEYNPFTKIPSMMASYGVAGVGMLAATGVAGMTQKYFAAGEYPSWIKSRSLLSEQAKRMTELAQTSRLRAAGRGVVKNFADIGNMYVHTGSGIVSGYIGRKLGLEGNATKYISPGIGMVFSNLTITDAVKEEGSTFGAYIGFAEETGAALGSFIGGTGGAILGAVTGGPIGAVVGRFAGMLAGGLAGYSVAPTMYKMSQAIRNWGSPELGGKFFDNMYTATMRQRSMLAIRTSQMNLRSELGREAQLLMNASF